MDPSRVKPREIAQLIFLSLKEFRKTSPSSFQLGEKFYWLGAYSTALPPAGSVFVGKEHTPPWRLCRASSWAELYSQLVELDKQGRVPSMMMLCPALGEMPETLPDSFSRGVERGMQAIARSEGVDDFPRSIGGIAEFISAKHQSKVESVSTEKPARAYGNLVEQRNFVLAKAYNEAKDNKAQIAAAALDKIPWIKQDNLLIKWGELSFTGALKNRPGTVKSLFSKTANRYKSNG